MRKRTGMTLSQKCFMQEFRRFQFVVEKFYNPKYKFQEGEEAFALEQAYKSYCRLNDIMVQTSMRFDKEEWDRVLEDIAVVHWELGLRKFEEESA